MTTEVTESSDRPAHAGQTPELAALYRDLAAVDLRPLWTITERLLPATPRPSAVPWLWAAATMKPLARRAIALVPVDRGGSDGC
jgi:gentisate 1,2-dioxygenase